MAQLVVSTTREDKAVFHRQPCISILKVGKIFRKALFRGVEFLRDTNILFLTKQEI